jgi:23S rRNA pseudouridine2605 synthase
MDKKRNDNRPNSEREESSGQTQWPWDKKKSASSKKGIKHSKRSDEKVEKKERNEDKPKFEDKKRPSVRAEKDEPASGEKKSRGGQRPMKSKQMPKSFENVGKRRSDGRSDKDGNRKTRSYPKGRKSSSSPATSNRADQEPYLKDEIRLNKFMAHAGLCSRREADEYIESGKVRVNGVVVTELGVKVKPTDNVEVEKQKLSLEPFVYILLNKGKDTISTTDDEKDRNTVMNAIEDATGYRVYPVGRLDRNTMGLLLLSNDGDLAYRLMHPSYQVKKTYEVTANRPLTEQEVANLSGTLELEDGPVKAKSVKQDPMNPAVVVISVFEGRNHLIRRMIAQIGADVDRLKRIRYAGLTDDDLRVGRWRYLKQKEINDLRKLVKLDTLDFNRDAS